MAAHKPPTFLLFARNADGTLSVMDICEPRGFENCRRFYRYMARSVRAGEADYFLVGERRVTRADLAA